MSRLLPALIFHLLLISSVVGQGSDLLDDSAKILDQSVDAPIVRSLQKKALEEHQVPIAVVTVDRLPRGSSIEAYADELFAARDLGDKGMLILVDRHGRQAFIKPGLAWGPEWDDRFDNILAQDLVANLKKKRYAESLIDGVAALKIVASYEPDARSGHEAYLDQFNRSDFAQFLTMTTPLPPFIAAILGILGLLCFLFIAIDRSNAATYVQLGSALIGLGMFPYVIAGMIVLVAFMWLVGQSGGSLGGGDGCGGGCGGCSSCGGCGGCG